MRRTSLRERAAELCDHGWAVFPCKPGSKLPACKWSEEWTKDPDYAWDEWPAQHNIGVNCGASSMIVADLDVKGSADGVAAFRWAAGGRLPRTFTVETPSGGLHLYFRNKVLFGNSTGGLPPGIDIRGVGGYVLGPGSVIGGSEYEIVHDVPVMPLPGWLKDVLTPPVTIPLPRERQKSRWAPEPVPVLLKRLDGAVDAVATAGPGERNQVLHWAACRVGEVLDRVDEDEAIADLLHACEVNGLLSEDGEYRVMATIRSGLRNGAL